MVIDRALTGLQLAAALFLVGALGVSAAYMALGALGAPRPLTFEVQTVAGLTAVAVGLITSFRSHQRA